MSKIVQALNAMISNPERIGGVEIFRDREVYFGYQTSNDVHIWSMAKDENSGDYWAWYYPGCESVREAVELSEIAGDGVPLVSYNSGQIGTREAKATFAELYIIVREKVYGVDKALDDIIDSF